MTATKVCLIGAGPSGVATAKKLKDHGIAFDCFEKGSDVGGNWRYLNDNGASASYASLHINTSKNHSAFSDLAMPEDYPDFPHHSQVLAYFESYVDRFDLRPNIHFKSTVTRVTPEQGSDWRVEVEGPEGRWCKSYRAVVVANGHHWCPKVPAFPGRFEGRTLHSHDYKTPDSFAGQRVLVVGMGNSGAEIASEVSRVASTTVLSARRSAHILPKYLYGWPVDEYIGKLGRILPTPVLRKAFELSLLLARGPQERYGIPKPDFHLLQGAPTVTSDLLQLVGNGKVRMRPNLERLDGDGVTFVDGSREEFDVVVFATGYRIRFPFLDPEIFEAPANEVRLYRQVVHPEHPSLLFVGLVQPFGSVFPIAEAQGRWVAKLLAGESLLPSRATMQQRIRRDRVRQRRRMVKSERHTLQVLPGEYLKILAKEMRRTGKVRPRLGRSAARREIEAFLGGLPNQPRRATKKVA